MFAGSILGIALAATLAHLIAAARAPHYLLHAPSAAR